MRMDVIHPGPFCNLFQDVPDTSNGQTLMFIVIEQCRSCIRPVFEVRLKVPDRDRSTQLNLTIPGTLRDRLGKYWEADERSKSWAVQKALDKRLAERGY